MADHGKRGGKSASNEGAREELRTRPHAQTREQERARLAWDWVQKARACANSKRYGTLARKLPTYLRTSGFEQTMAFLFSKSERLEQKPEGLLFAQLARHCMASFRDRGGVLLLQPNATLSQMMTAMVELSLDDSRRAAQEALCISEWLQRFAPTELGEEKE